MFCYRCLSHLFGVKGDGTGITSLTDRVLVPSTRYSQVVMRCHLARHDPNIGAERVK